MKTACTSIRLGVIFLLLTGLLGCATPRGEGKAADDKKGANPSQPAPGVIEAEQVVPNAALRGDKPEVANAPAPAAAPETVPPAPPAAQAPALEANPSYKIGPGDLLDFRSFDDEKFSGPVAVRYDGMISLPMVADVKVDGLSREDATKAIREAYSAIYNDPQLTLTVTETRSKFFTVMGDVARPSEFPYTRPLNLLDSIVKAGGLRASMSGSETYVGSAGQLVKALLIRHTDGARNVTEYNLRNMKTSGPHASDTALLPGDVVYIPESINLIYLLGDVNRPSIYRITEGMTLLMLLANAGGLREPTARMKQVVLIREINTDQSKVMLVNVKEILKTGKDIPLSPGDVIYVPRRRLVNIGAFVSQVTGTVSPALGLSQQVLSLYGEAYDAYYTRERFDRLFKDQGSSYSDTLSVLQNVRDLTTLYRNESPYFSR